MTGPLTTRSSPRRLHRLYRYFRGNVGDTLYAVSGYACTRRRSLKLAWRYTRKGGGQCV